MLYEYQSTFDDVQSARTITLAFILFELFLLESHYLIQLFAGCTIQYDTKKGGGVGGEFYVLEKQILVLLVLLYEQIHFTTCACVGGGVEVRASCTLTRWRREHDSSISALSFAFSSFFLFFLPSTSSPVPSLFL